MRRPMRAWLTKATPAGYSTSRSLHIAIMFAGLAISCRGDGRSPERGSAPPAGSAQPPPPAPMAAGSAAVPAGDPKLYAVPNDVSKTVGLKEIARGLDRPVL